MQNDMGNKIRTLRLSLGLTLEQVAAVVGVGKSTVRKWETGAIANMRRDKIAALAQALHTSPGYLMGWDENLGDVDLIPPGFSPLPERTLVPRVGAIACGEPILAEQNIETYDAVPSVWHADFSLVCRGESMAPKFENGDIVAIRKMSAVENGEIAAVRIDDEATLKRVYQYEDRIVLQPENISAFAPIVLIGDEMNRVTIEGKAVGLCRTLK